MLNKALPREGLGTGIFEPIIYSLLVCFLAWFFCFLYSSVRKNPKSKIFFGDFLINLLINFFIFYACLVADLIRGWSFLKFTIIFFPLVFLINSFFFLLRMVYNKDTLGWELIFFLSLFLILPLLIHIRERMGLIVKIK